MTQMTLGEGMGERNWHGRGVGNNTRGDDMRRVGEGASATVPTIFKCLSLAYTCIQSDF